MKSIFEYNSFAILFSIELIRFDLFLQCLRHKESLEEELKKCQDSISRLTEINVKLAKEKEVLANEKANWIVQLTAAERENRSLSEEMSAIK